jgi:signal peptidase II
MVTNDPAPTPAAGPSRLQRLLAYRRLWVLALAVLAVDQASKAWIAAHLPFPTYGPPDHIVIVPGFFHLVHVGNTGAAWSLLTGKSTLLAVLALATLVAIWLFRRHLALRHPAVQTCFGLMCGGIAGNLVDRLWHGHVVDFLDFHFGRWVYPTFNVADSAIVCGVALYLLQSWRAPPAQPNPPAPPSSPRP